MAYFLELTTDGLSSQALHHTEHLSVNYSVNAANRQTLQNFLEQFKQESSLKSLRINLEGHVENRQSLSPFFQRRQAGRPRSPSGISAQTHLFRALICVLRNNRLIEELTLIIDPTLLILTSEQMEELNRVLSSMALRVLNLSIAAESSSPALVLSIDDKKDLPVSIELTTPGSEDSSIQYASCFSALQTLKPSAKLSSLVLKDHSVCVDAEDPAFQALIKVLTNSLCHTLQIEGVEFTQSALTQLLAHLPTTTTSLKVFTPGQRINAANTEQLGKILQGRSHSVAVLDLTGVYLNEMQDSTHPLYFDYLMKVLKDNLTLSQLLLSDESISTPITLSSLLALLSGNQRIINLSITGSGKLDPKEFKRFCHFLTESACHLKSLSLNWTLSEEEQQVLQQALALNQSGLVIRRAESDEGLSPISPSP